MSASWDKLPHDDDGIIKMSSEVIACIKAVPKRGMQNCRYFGMLCLQCLNFYSTYAHFQKCDALNLYTNVKKIEKVIIENDKNQVK